MAKKKPFEARGEGFPALIQRVMVRTLPSETQRGIDRFFQFDYMGSSEFEWGALPQAAKAMRANVGKEWKAEPLEARGHKCWYVGAPTTKKMAEMVFAEQLQEDRSERHYTKEWTCIYETYVETANSSTFDAWWALDAEPPFVLFRRAEDAKLWLRCLREKP